MVDTVAVPHANLDDAATAALWALARELEPRREHIGLLYDTPSGIDRTPTRDAGGTRRAAGTFSIPGGTLRGIFHNHPPREIGRGARDREDKERADFSGDDTLQARSLGVPSYISVDQQIFRYDPKTRLIEEVLGQIPVEEIRKLYIVEALKK